VEDDGVVVDPVGRELWVFDAAEDGEVGLLGDVLVERLPLPATVPSWVVGVTASLLISVLMYGSLTWPKF
jgi:hypothetical protein